MNINKNIQVGLQALLTSPTAGVVLLIHLTGTKWLVGAINQLE